MGKKEAKDKAAAVAEPGGALKHNPFAALAAQRDALPASEPADSAAASAPKAAQPLAPGKSRGRLVLARETKHRGGKPVVIVRGFAELRDFDDVATEQLAKELKSKLGCGGTVERHGSESSIVLQGDRPAKVAELLRARGFRVDGVTS